MSENDILEYLFPSEINYVLWRPITVIGLSSSGKTNFSLYIAKLVRDISILFFEVFFETELRGQRGLRFL